MISRKNFIRSGLITSAGLLFSSYKMQCETKNPLSPELVQDFVGSAHNNLEHVKELHKQYPTLLNAAWDWGGGDFETALGAASHVGDIEIINYLLENGAQMNFLTLCVLGKLDLVKQMHSEYPFLIHMKGPHGYTPLHHAIKGEQNSLAVKEYLEKNGAVETRIILVNPE